MELFVDIEKKLKGFTLNVKFNSKKDAMGLLGASGSGKSMTLRCIAGIEKPDKGKIVLNGRTLFDSKKKINIPSRERKVGYLFQNYALFPNMTVEENIEFALEKLSKKKRNEIVQNKIRMMKLENLGKRYPSQLSGGQQQRVALARALAIEPEALLLDEPFSALDNHLRNFLTKQLIDTLRDYRGVTLFVTHNMEEAYRICNNLVVLRGGNVEALGSKEDIFQKPPTLSAAKLTGCKNCSTAKYISANELYAVDWGIKLNVKQNMDNNLKHVGMRAHYIRQASDKNQDNVFNCWPSFVSEGPFKVTIYLAIGNKPKDIEYYHLQWEITKEKWFELKKESVPWKIYIDSDKLLVFDD